MLQEHIIRAESPPGENEERDTSWTGGPPFDSQSDFNNRVWEGMQRIHREVRRTRAELEELRMANSSKPTGRRRR